MTAYSPGLADTSAPLKLAFVGGSIQSAAGYAHFSASAMDRRWQLVAGCFSKDAAVNAQTAEVYGVSNERLYATWQDLLAQEKGRIDAVAILTPTPAHFDMVIAAMQAGIPVICEKALAVSPSEAQKILDVRDAHKAFLAVTYNYTGYPMLRELAKLIADGKLGKLIHFQAEMPQEGFIRLDAKGNKPAPQAWRLSDGDIPTLHLDLAVHLHQIIHYLTGQTPIELVADQNHYGRVPGVVDNVNCLCRYSEGVQGQIWFSKSALGHRNGLRIRLYGELASAEWEQINPEEIHLSHVNGRREILDRASAVEVTNERRYNRFKSGHPAGFIEAFANLYADIADSVIQYQQHGRWSSSEVFSVELAHDGMHFLDAMVRSAKTRSWQTVSSKAHALSVNGGIAQTANLVDLHAQREIRAVILDLLQKKSALPATFNDDTDFFAAGVIDSMGIIKFVIALEAHFDIAIDEADLESCTFRSVSGLVNIVQAKLKVR
jgi:predicted dehydrogenase/acyl carrier protein